MIKNIVFDIGNVLLNFNPLEYLSSRFDEPAIVDSLHRCVFCSTEWLQLDQGLITEDDAVRIFCQRNPKNRSAIEYVMSDWYNLLTPIDDTVNILKQLKAKGLNAYALSNFHLKAFEYCYSKYDFFKLFDGLVISSKVKYLKPDTKIYQRLIEEYSIKPQSTIFIDDTKQNIDAAILLGFLAIHFSTPDELKKELDALISSF